MFIKFCISRGTDITNKKGNKRDIQKRKRNHIYKMFKYDFEENHTGQKKNTLIV